MSRWPPLDERFWGSLKKSPSGCWNWTGYLCNGYGRVSVKGKPIYAHRYAYELLVAPIPDGLTIDHLCRNRACVNPDHLEPVTRWENTRRAGAIESAARNRRSSAQCVNGHDFSEDNTYWHNGQRACVTCRRERSKLFHEKNRERRNRQSQDHRQTLKLAAQMMGISGREFIRRFGKSTKKAMEVIENGDA